MGLVKGMANKPFTAGTILTLALVCFTPDSSEAGHYKLASFSGSGSVTTVTPWGSTQQSVTTYWDEDDPCSGDPNDGKLLPLTSVYGDSSVTAELTETYNIEWVPDYPGELPITENWGIDWDHHLTWIGNSGFADFSAGLTGYTKATITSGGSGTYELAGSMASTPDGMGWADISSSGDFAESGRYLGWLDAAVNGEAVSITVKYECGILTVGPAMGELAMQRTPAAKKTSSIILQLSGSGKVGFPINVDATCSTTRRAKPDPNASPSTGLKVVTSVSHATVTVTPVGHQINGQQLNQPITVATFTPAVAGQYTFTVQLKWFDGKQWHTDAFDSGSKNVIP